MNMQYILSASSSDDLDHLAELADRLTDTIGPHGSIMAVGAASPGSRLKDVLEDRLSSLEKSMSELLTTFKSLSFKIHKYYSEKNKNTETNSRREINTRESVCKYHRKFGDQARFCKIPCNYKTQPGNA